jgi:hypothetical protein
MTRPFPDLGLNDEPQPSLHHPPVTCHSAFWATPAITMPASL